MVLSTDCAVYMFCLYRYRYYLKREEAHCDVVKI
ncbi:hypothetical protein ACVWV0_001366 [Ewingella americana]|uniref:Uncharacterized protein n=1 Tax=Ewingella americana TaxID=41202 RepID=A0A377N8Y3_9GAMM|nr:Uncharacterised protein [Ewingella americana]